MPVITLTTDFGQADWFVGTMKGVIASINPKAAVIDITHGIPAGDIRAGAFALMAACRYFPAGTIHVAVVDPGVGSGRQMLAIQTARYTFLGPDNGLLSWAAREEKINSIRLLQNPKLALPTVSATFHGRDIFAPMAAHLSRGAKLSAVGPRLHKFMQLPWPEPRYNNGTVRGEVVYIDHFGNAMTNIPKEETGCPAEGIRTYVGKHVLNGRSRCYAAVRPGQPTVLLNSSGFYELAINGGSAAERLGLRVGTPVRMQFRR